VFQQQFGKENCLYQRTSDEFCDWEKLDEKVLNKYRIYAGHYNYAPKDTKSEPLIFSVIRDPVDRAISLYHYLKTRPEHKLHTLAVNEDILTFYKKAVEIAPDYVSDTQTLRVSGTRDFDTARKIIEEKYFLIAPFDELDKVFGVFQKFSLISAANVPEKKVSSPYKASFYDNDLRDFILNINEADAALYEYSKIYFHRLLSDVR